MTNRDKRKLCMDIFFGCIRQKPKATTKLYKDVSKLMTELSEKFNYDILLFCLQTISSQLQDPYYISKFNELNVFQRKGYIIAMINSSIDNSEVAIKREQLKFVEHSEYGEEYKLTLQDNKRNNIDISKFLGVDD